MLFTASNLPQKKVQAAARAGGVEEDGAVDKAENWVIHQNTRRTSRRVEVEVEEDKGNEEEQPQEFLGNTVLVWVAQPSTKI